MARRTIISIDEKIEKAKASVERLKAKYDAAVDELNNLMAKRDELKKEELITAIISSNKSYDEILNFIINDS
jgi:uncharacterized coiled-coil DUF342 family protein